MDPQKFQTLCDQLLVRKKKSIINNTKLLPDAGRDESFRLAPKPKEESCEDCGQIVKGRSITIYRSGIGTEHEHWRKNCQICSKKTPLDIKIINRVV